MSTQRAGSVGGATDRHRAAVASTLRWAQEAADRGDYADALEWVRTIEAIGDQLPPSYRTHRQAWRSALAQNVAKREGS
jgi:hypothetical protein